MSVADHVESHGDRVKTFPSYLSYKLPQLAKIHLKIKKKIKRLITIGIVGKKKKKARMHVKLFNQNYILEHKRFNLSNYSSKTIRTQRVN